MRIILLIFIILLSFWLKGQKAKSDSAVELKVIDIYGERLRTLSAGLKTQSIDSLTLTRYSSSNLSDILTDETPVYVKSYGMGGLADLSIRGTSYAQSGVFWNGFNINVANIGMVDLSLIPVIYFNKIDILYGGNSSIYGDGIIGGSIHLENTPLFIKANELDVISTVGSFQTYDESVKSVVSNEHMSALTVFTTNSSKNDFPFTNVAQYGEPNEKQMNAGIRGDGLLEDINFKLTTDELLKASIWYQDDDRDIPPAMTESTSEANETDESLRSAVEWKKVKDDLEFTLKGAYFYDYENYVDPLSGIYSKIINNIGISDGEVKKTIGNTEIYAGMHYELEEANIQEYYGIKEQNREAIFASITHNFRKADWQISLNMRQEFIEGYKVPITPSIGAEGKIWNCIYSRLNVSQNYRSPTLNDLYWQPGGNQNLQPEISQNEEAGIVIKSGKLKVKSEKSGINQWEVGLTAFNSEINNCIEWIPINADLSSPENISRVWSRGLEAEGKLKLTTGQLRLEIRGSYSYIRSTDDKKINANNESYGKQLIYTPVNSGIAGLSIMFKSYDISYNQTFTGLRYVTSDDLNLIDGYSLGNVKLNKTFKIRHKTRDMRHETQDVRHETKTKQDETLHSPGKTKIKYLLRVQFDIDNIWNINYQAIQYYPMPGRIYRVSLHLTIDNG